MGNLADNMARLREEIEALRAARQANVLDLRRGVADMQANFRGVRMEAARRAKDERMQFLNEIASFVSGLRISVFGMRQEFMADLAGARRVWSGRSPSGKNAVKKEAPQMYSVDTGVHVMEIDEAVASDDLTAIPGIGPGRMERLNAAGIHSFTQLARSTPEELCGILGKPLKMADVEKWIAQAGELAGKY